MNYLSLLPLLALGACASIVSGQHQSISVRTYPDDGAKCQLNNSKGEWFVPSTPGSVDIRRAYGDLDVVCTKGNRTGLTRVSSRTKGMALGNVIFGGVIGAGVDVGTGAAYDYPQVIRVTLEK